MNIEKILDEVEHKVFLFITWKRIYIQEWIMDQKSVIRVTYNRSDLEKDKLYIGGDFI